MQQRKATIQIIKKKEVTFWPNNVRKNQTNYSSISFVRAFLRSAFLDRMTMLLGNTVPIGVCRVKDVDSVAF